MLSPVQFAGRYKISIELPDAVKADAPHLEASVREEVFELAMRDITHKNHSDERAAILTAAPDGKAENARPEERVILIDDAQGDTVVASGKHAMRYAATKRMIEVQHDPVPTPQDFLRARTEAMTQSLLARFNAYANDLMTMVRHFTDTEGVTEVKVRVVDSGYVPQMDQIHYPRFEYVDPPEGFVPQFGTVPEAGETSEAE